MIFITPLKESYYNYYVTNNFETLIYNFLHSTCVILSENEFKQFNNKNLNKEYTNQLRDLGIYVPADLNELDYYLSLKRIASENDRVAFYRIYTTYNCNAHCFYCYESGVEKKYLDFITANKIINYIKETSSNSSKIFIEWFGGEPLMNQKVIDKISEDIIEFATENKILYESRMITNGLLFNNDIIEKSKNRWNLKFIQITLDGLKDTYENTKKFKIENSFETVINNIENLLINKIYVNIRINYSNSNINEILKLLEFLNLKFKKYNNLNIYCKEIMSVKNKNNIYTNIDNNIKIFKKLYDLDLTPNILDSMPIRNYKCVANKINAHIIDPNGNIGKCSQALAKKDFVGNIEKGLNINNLSKWISPRLTNKIVDCTKCKFLPICNGGCNYEYLQNKNFCFANEKLINYKLTLYLNEYVKGDNL